MMKRLLTGIGLIGCLWIFAGCAEVVVPGTIAGGGEYYRYTTGGVAKKTFVSDVDRAAAAARNVLKTMNIQYDSTSHEDSGTEIKASTDELDITIFLTPITAATTQVHVSAAKNSVFKDKATADEILDQIKLELERKSAPDNAFPKVFVKNDCRRAVDIIVYYLDGKNGPATWQTRGWFSVAPGQQKYVADTHNRYIYFYGETRSDNKTVWTGNLPQWFEGKRYNFFKVDMGTALVDYTHAFRCD